MCNGVHPFIPIVAGAKIEFVQSYGGQTVVNVIYADHVPSFTSTELAELAAECLDWGEDIFIALHDETWEFETVRVTDMTSEVGSVLELSPSTPANGTHAASGGLPGGSAVVVTFRTAKRGRSYRGRNYVGGLPNVLDTNPNLVGSTYAALVETVYQNLATALDSIGWRHIIASQCQGGLWLASAVKTAVTSYDANTSIDSQRRRLAGRGE